MVGGFLYWGLFTYPQLQQVNDGADGIPVTGPSTFSSLTDGEDREIYGWPEASDTYGQFSDLISDGRAVVFFINGGFHGHGGQYLVNIWLISDEYMDNDD